VFACILLLLLRLGPDYLAFPRCLLQSKLLRFRLDVLPLLFATLLLFLGLSEVLFPGVRMDGFVSVSLPVLITRGYHENRNDKAGLSRKLRKLVVVAML